MATLFHSALQEPSICRHFLLDKFHLVDRFVVLFVLWNFYSLCFKGLLELLFYAVQLFVLELCGNFFNEAHYGVDFGGSFGHLSLLELLEFLKWSRACDAVPEPGLHLIEIMLRLHSSILTSALNLKLVLLNKLLSLEVANDCFLDTLFKQLLFIKVLDLPVVLFKVDSILLIGADDHFGVWIQRTNELVFTSCHWGRSSVGPVAVLFELELLLVG